MAFVQEDRKVMANLFVARSRRFEQFFLDIARQLAPKPKRRPADKQFVVAFAHTSVLPPDVQKEPLRRAFVPERTLTIRHRGRFVEGR